MVDSAVGAGNKAGVPGRLACDHLGHISDTGEVGVGPVFDIVGIFGTDARFNMVACQPHTAITDLNVIGDGAVGRGETGAAVTAHPVNLLRGEDRVVDPSHNRLSDDLILVGGQTHWNAHPFFRYYCLGIVEAVPGQGRKGRR